MHRNVKNIIMSAMTVATLAGGIVAPSLLDSSLFGPQVVNAYTSSNVNVDPNMSGQAGTGITINNFVAQSTTGVAGGTTNGKAGNIPDSWRYAKGTFRISRIKPTAGANNMTAPSADGTVAGTGYTVDSIIMGGSKVNNGPLIQDKLDYGYYLVQQTAVGDKNGPLMTPIIVTLPMIDSDDNVNNMITIYPKNNVLQETDEDVKPITRIVSDGLNQRLGTGAGNTVTYDLGFNIPVGVGEDGMNTAGSLSVTNNLGSDKTLATNSVTVTLGTTTSPQLLSLNDDYTLSTSGNTATVVFTKAGLDKLQAYNGATGVSKTVHIRLDAKVAPSVNAGIVTNDFAVNFNLNGDLFTHSSVNTLDTNSKNIGTAQLLVGGFDILKVGKIPKDNKYVNDDGLIGAKFELYEDSAATTQPVKKGKDGTPAAGIVYLFDDWVAKTGSDTTNYETYTVTTDQQGRASFGGLPIEDWGGNENGKNFFIKEIEAPVNFEKTNKAINVLPEVFLDTATTSYDGTGITVTGNNDKFEAIIVNHMKTTFPVAGSNGYIYAIVGLVLVMGGTVIVLKKTKKEDVEG